MVLNLTFFLDSAIIINRWPERAILKTTKIMNIASLPGKTIVFFKEVRLELKKVNWPSRRDTVKYTLIVIGASLVIAAFLGGLDFLLQTLRDKFILNRFAP